MKEIIKYLESKGHSRTEILVALVQNFDYSSDELFELFTNDSEEH